MENTNLDLLDFLSRSPTPFHAAHNVKLRLIEDGYTELFEGESWNLKRGEGYFFLKGGSSLVAFRIPLDSPDGFQIVASHTDSPALKLKPSFELESGGYLKLSSEKYGGAVLSSWLDRPLGVAGRVVVKEGMRLVTRLVHVDRDIALIPSVAPHLTKEEIKLNPAVDLSALIGGKESADKLMSLVADSAGVEKEKIASHDLYLVSRERGRVWGVSGEFVSAPRLDDLQCVYASLIAFLMSSEETNIPVLALFNSEEIGSSTVEGAGSVFFADALRKISDSLGEDSSRLLLNSFMVSADNAHAVHPNHPELTDPLNNAYLNGGIVIKHNANMRYITDAESEAVFIEVCKRAGVPVSHYTNRSDIAGGSTLGNIAVRNLSISGVDVGLPQLAMHSHVETVGAYDTECAVRAFEAFFSAHIKKDKNSFVVE